MDGYRAWHDSLGADSFVGEHPEVAVYAGGQLITQCQVEAVLCCRDRWGYGNSTFTLTTSGA